MKDIEAYGKQAVDCLIDKESRQELRDWLALLDDCLVAAGTLNGSAEKQEIKIAPHFSKSSYHYDPAPQRDERFVNPFNMGVNVEGFLLDKEQPALPKLIVLYFKRLREIDVPEMMASIIEETKDKPWNYYKDMIRQLWDESRHAMMGELGFLFIGH